jgi:hypothetical protein
VHVRYGPQARICALTETAQWEPLAAEAGLAAAARTPLLIETPWNLPHDLVLVHVPAFDSGLPDAESIVLEASSRANEILALFSRQLSDRELDLYGRLAPLGKPMTFVHTLADHESSNDRRNVVRLAERYLRERAIIPQRLFTTSTRDKSAWNEIGALRETLIAHANEHADRVRRVAREREEQARLAAIPSNTSVAKASFFARLFGRSRP